MMICDMDCFHCKFDDCINDEIDNGYIVNEVGKEKGRSSNEEYMKAKRAVWFQENKVRIREKRKAKREADKIKSMEGKA